MPPRRHAPPRCIDVRQSHIHGVGVFATCKLPAGKPLGHYRGRVLTRSQFLREYPPDRFPAYVLQIGNLFIDGSQTGNWVCRVNDAWGTKLENNCAYFPEQGLTVIRTIYPGEELLWSYGADYWREYNRIQNERRAQKRRRQQQRRRYRRYQRRSRSPGRSPGRSPSRSRSHNHRRRRGRSHRRS